MQTLIRCPKCGSDDVTYNFILKIIICNNCGHKFKEEAEKP